VSSDPLESRGSIPAYPPASTNKSNADEPYMDEQIKIYMKIYIRSEDVRGHGMK
jgi:hypothetical protein